MVWIVLSFPKDVSQIPIPIDVFTVIRVPPCAFRLAHPRQVTAPGHSRPAILQNSATPRPIRRGGQWGSEHHKTPSPEGQNLLQSVDSQTSSQTEAAKAAGLGPVSACTGARFNSSQYFKITQTPWPNSAGSATFRR
jgi:hypothetical protein